MMYAAKIDIVREPREIKFTKKVTIHGLLSVREISQHVKKGETFDVFREEGGLYGPCFHLEINARRMETKTEMKKRIAKEELYMRNYEIFHEKYKR